MNLVPRVEHQKVLIALLGPNDEVVYRRQKCHFITTRIKGKHRQMNKKGGECKGTVGMVIKGKEKRKRNITLGKMEGFSEKNVRVVSVKINGNDPSQNQWLVLTRCPFSL
ncbi:hypothetical protein TNIN_468171 [Trichonephila inaurata madagascariensis]|uniref:Uncharacterized protein n=1 Tax=Trichonephila inaurata madagascariensis TaxID=2747483 RepID=A0A8X6X9A6_9ARAC|nr:hypothetical protein TNIN_468171 [Trichonephila inaurata madagascariensis]